ncbi:MAG: DUF2461 domain-containing protein [Bacteroidota bacterium]
MLQPSTLKFIKDLKKNNNKPWFDANRKKYEEAKKDFVAFVDSLILSIAKFDPAVASLKAKDCIFRINRDIRFSKDKSPYKTNMGAYINPGGKKINTPGYYFHCEPGGGFAAGGLYVPEPAVLAKVRQEIDYSFDEWKKIVNDKTFKKYFPKVDGIEVLSRPPKGYSDDNPAIEFLKMKSYIVSRPLTDAQFTDKNLLKEVSKIFETMKPMIDFLNNGMS